MTRDHRVVMVVGSSDARHDGVADYVRHLVPALGDAGIDVVTVEMTSLDDTGRRVRAAAPDVVHVQFAPSAFGFSSDVGRLPPLLGPDVPLVTTAHEDGDLGQLASSTVVVTNTAHADALRTRISASVELIPLAPNVSRRHGGRDASGAPVLAFFGYVHPVKGVRYLLEALSLLPDTRLLVIGGFTSLALPDAEARRFRAELETLAARLGVTHRVRFTGYLPPDEVSELLGGADVGVLPFTHGVTTKSGALLTLFAHGLPTVVTDGGDPDLVDGRNVCVAPGRRDGPALAGTIRRLLADDGLRQRLAGEAIRFAAPRTWDGVAARHRELYERVIGG
jgi:glycosyltransferase involved in cell wall biosynthesis